jgi:LEA14-like dessication related protein
MTRSTFVAMVVASCLTTGCETTHPPEITAETVTTMKIGPEGADIDASLDTYNPNKSALTTTGFESKVTIGGKPDVARAVVSQALTLPAGQRVRLKLPIRVEWTDPAAIKALAEAKAPASYTVTGAVHFSTGKGKDIQTPFKISGTMGADELGRAAGLAPAKPAASASGSAPKPAR